MAEKMKYYQDFSMPDIVDTQAHIGPGRIEETLAAMNALGIKSLLIDELWLENIKKLDFAPYHRISENAERPIAPTAELASALYPDRFGYVLRVLPHDPDAEAVIRLIAASPGCKGIRIEPGTSRVLVEMLKNGRYDTIFRTVEKEGLPIFLYLPDRPNDIGLIAGQYPKMKLVIDHCGIYANSNRAAFHTSNQNLSFDEAVCLFEKVLELSRFVNVYLKWSHASENFEIPVFPGDKLRPLLRRAIQAFGANRILWASDFSVNQRSEHWSELLFGMLTNDDLTRDELCQIMGGTARELLSWHIK